MRPPPSRRLPAARRRRRSARIRGIAAARGRSSDENNLAKNNSP
jgi:hypothetical protein